MAYRYIEHPYLWQGGGILDVLINQSYLSVGTHNPSRLLWTMWMYGFSVFLVLVLWCFGAWINTDSLAWESAWGYTVPEEKTASESGAKIRPNTASKRILSNLATALKISQCLNKHRFYVPCSCMSSYSSWEKTVNYNGAKLPSTWHPRH